MRFVILALLSLALVSESFAGGVHDTAPARHMDGAQCVAGGWDNSHFIRCSGNDGSHRSGGLTGNGRLSGDDNSHAL
jgi:hypothetical protein